jgi:hypothetical protein
MIALTYDNLNKTINEDLTGQIYKLKSEVSKQYQEYFEMFNKVRMEAKEAQSLKEVADRELSKLKDEIDRRNETNIVFENHFRGVLEKHAPYNNMHIPISEVNPIYLLNSKNRQRHLNLESTSTMVFNKNEFANEKSQNISSLAQRGQNLIADSEFVPIPEPKSSYDRQNTITNIGNISSDNMIINEMKESEGNFDELYSKLNEIKGINSRIDPMSKYKQRVLRQETGNFASKNIVNTGNINNIDDFANPFSNNPINEDIEELAPEDF